MIRKFGANNYFIKPGYHPRLKNQYFVDSNTTELIFQPEVYELAGYLAERSGATHIIDIGAGKGDKLKEYSKRYRVIAIDFGSNLNDLKKNIPDATIIDTNLENGLPKLDREIVKNSVIISADVIEHLKKPKKYIRGLAELSQIAHFTLISTPDRVRARGIGDFGPPANLAHVREWSIDELDNLICNSNFAGHMTGYTINTNIHQEKRTSLVVSSGSLPRQDIKDIQPELKRVQAIVTLYNERDIIPSVVNHLLDQGVDIHVIDNWSSDGSFEYIKKLATSNSRVTFERYPETKPRFYEWGDLLSRVESLANKGGYDWYMHYDSDEIRLSPWRGLNLQEAITFVDVAGYSAIDFTVLDFRPIEDGFSDKTDPESFFRYCEFGERPGHFIQIKAWKNTGRKVNISNSGGHEAVFENRKVYPIKFLNKHYSIRSNKQGKKKIGIDRQPRVSPKERLKGWNTHYDELSKRSDFLWDKDQLVFYYQNEFFSNYFVELISGVGILNRP